MTRTDFIVGAVVILAALCLPFGLVMAFYTGEIAWLFFCTPILIFLS